MIQFSLKETHKHTHTQKSHVWPLPLTEQKLIRDEEVTRKKKKPSPPGDSFATVLNKPQ